MSANKEHTLPIPKAGRKRQIRYIFRKLTAGAIRAVVCKGSAPKNNKAEEQASNAGMPASVQSIHLFSSCRAETGRRLHWIPCESDNNDRPRFSTDNGENLEDLGSKYPFLYPNVAHMGQEGLVFLKAGVRKFQKARLELISQ